MLHYISNLKDDAYTIEIEGKKHYYSISAFADDTQIFSSTHKGYQTRFNHLTSYLATFKVALSPAKTHYTYVSPEHKEAACTISINKYSQQTQRRTEDNTQDVDEEGEEEMKPEETKTPTNVASPHEALRYLGAYLSLAGDWKYARTFLMQKIDKSLSTIQFKHLEWREVKYIVTSTIQAQIQYYTLVTPLTQTELENLDSRITQKFRNSLKLASSTNAHILHMDDKRSFGYGLPSVLDTHDHTLINAAQATLTSSKPLGDLVRHSLKQYQTETGWTTNPLNRRTCPNKPPKVNYWFSRVREAMDRQDINIPITEPHRQKTSQ